MKSVVPAHGKALVDTQLSMVVPRGTYGRIAPRSGLGKLSFSIYKYLLT
jgi:dUTP pyrophosphatase